jgi:dTDP-glucose pyrophosphorylase
MKNTLIYNDHTSFEDAIRYLDENGNGFLAVVDGDNKLIGILTDGDIRRAILHKKTDLKDIINRHPVTLNSTVPRRQAIQYLKSIHRRHLPLVDDDNRLIDVIILDDIEFNAKPNKVVIMAGGHGTRLGELTKNIPKPMLTVGNKPILEYILTHCYEHGFTNIYISVNYKSEVIKEYFRDGSNFGLNIRYIEEKERLGTAGALSLIEETFQEPFIVINGDILTTLNLDILLNHHINTKSDATMCTREIEYQVAYGVVNIDGTRITSLKEKPTQKVSINAGIYVLSPSVIKFIPKRQYYDMTSLFEQLLQNGLSVNSYPLKDYWIDIGQIQDYESANKDMQIDF